jgi:hypothetical protein
VHESVLFPIGGGDIERFGEANAEHNVAEYLKIKVLLQLELLLKHAQVWIALLLDRVEVRVARGQGVHCLEKLSLKLLSQEQIALVIGHDDLLLTQVLLLLDAVQFFLLPQLTIVNVLGQMVIDIIHVLPFPLVDLILDERHGFLADGWFKLILLVFFAGFKGLWLVSLGRGIG